LHWAPSPSGLWRWWEFTHPETGEHLPDHRDRAIWMGEMLDLDLSIFDRPGA